MSPIALDHSDRLTSLHHHLLSIAKASNGFLPFDEFMHASLYTPQLGYYTATRPVGHASSGADFTTAPEISPLFGHTIAQSIAVCFEDDLPKNVLECGAGTGQLAKDVLDGFAQQGIELDGYFILELSASLRAQQQALLVGYPCVVWLDALPSLFEGVVLANELLDALPVRAFALEAGQVFERGVVWCEIAHAWQWRQRLANDADQQAVLNLLTPDVIDLPRYELELCEQAYAWVASMAHCLRRGAMLLIDYGFAQNELYHPQRIGGTLMAHRLHQASTQVLAYPGDADITAHINFSAVSQQATVQGMACAGYVNQARFLINAGIANAYGLAAKPLGSVGLAKLSAGLQLLMNESEMGELFKVIAFTRSCPDPIGFERGDRSHRLIVAKSGIVPFIDACIKAGTTQNTQQDVEQGVLNA